MMTTLWAKLCRKYLATIMIKDTCYTLNEEAEKLFEEITDKYSGQFNLKYSSATQLSASQPVLDLAEKAEICVRTKVTELIGRLMCVLWVYCNGN